MRCYVVPCALLGFALGWLPMLVHGPIPYKYNVLDIDGRMPCGAGTPRAS